MAPFVTAVTVEPPFVPFFLKSPNTLKALLFVVASKVKRLLFVMDRIVPVR
jgi:hypothetical protein